MEPSVYPGVHAAQSEDTMSRDGALIPAGASFLYLIPCSSFHNPCSDKLQPRTYERRADPKASFTAEREVGP
ncbi:hypothetical protein GDO78_012808 [Eleutherodactylus coqui]|uniref:Uncharacterized protein n=1 Tax=Eleutherodactylus coqui TaxID=57060 RepID=A0A8J6F0R9_ELECQ|nr:hypothetical protein GDO78_012808 [Eleutherodactylus coqui]